MLFVLVAFFAVIMTWRQATMPWIQRRSDAINSINAMRSGSPSHYHDVVTAKGYRATRWRLPWSLWIWGDPNCMRYIYFCPDEVSKADQDNINELKELFPEADVAIKTRAEWNNFAKLVVPP